MEFVQPELKVKTPADMTAWQNSEAYNEYMGFVLAMNQAVKGKAISSTYPVSENIEKCVTLLETVDQWITDIPPVDQPQRFGNMAFRTFSQRMKDSTPDILQGLLPEDLHPAVIELAPYFKDSFGNETRIDYGTGHEMAFAMFLCCLFKINFLTKDDSAATVLRVFDRYMKLVRRLQQTYRMEPAGSHGVWSLDDYQFLPFIWGSSQLVMNPRIEPRHFVEDGVAERNSKDFLFMACIEYINQVKTGPFYEHSNQLWNISGIDNWSKVNQGLIKMYKAECLAKFPVIQHVYFGKLLSIEPQKKP